MSAVSDHKRSLERNIFLYYFFRTFNKRAYLPLITIYAIYIAHLSLSQIGLVASLTAAASLIMELPSGYLSDKIGHKKAIIIGHFIMMISPWGYVFMPNFWGILTGSVGYFGGYAFLSGTFEAFMHETLIALDREKEYSRVQGRMQAVSLLGNVVIIALVPLTYSIDHRLPFILGSFLIGINLFLSFLLYQPARVFRSAEEEKELSFYKFIRPIVGSRLIILFILLALAGSSSNKILELKEVYLLFFNMPVKALGFITAIASLLAAAASYNIHRLEKLTEKQYYFLHFFTVFILTVIAGFNRWPLFGIILIVLLVIYDRNESTLTKTYLLRRCPAPELKATFISLLAFTEAVIGIGVPLLLGYMSSRFGIQLGYRYFGESMLILSFILYILYYGKKEAVLGPGK